MGLGLAQALRLTASGPPRPTVAFVGAGGKTSAMFQLARQFEPPVLVSTTTHLGAWQIALADRHLVVTRPEDLPPAPPDGVTAITGPRVPAQDASEPDRFGPPPEAVLEWLHDSGRWNRAALLLEADGAHRKPLKAPVAYEPVIPPDMGMIVVVAGLSGLGRPLSGDTVHRPAQFAALSGLLPGQIVTPQGLERILRAPKGGLKGIPPRARRVVLLNQADDDPAQAQARSMVPGLLSNYDAVLIASLQSEVVHAVHEPVAGIVLAAGGSTRLGRPKPLLDWHGQPFIRRVASTALASGLDPVCVVTGSRADDVQVAMEGLPVTSVHNPEWQTGQASSIRAGLLAIPDRNAAALFLLADQPQVGPDVIRALVDRHAHTLAPIVAPLVRSERRGNPVLFDRLTFPDLMAMRGDVGGRAAFSAHRVDYLPWHDERLLLDVDTEDDYRRLLEEDAS